MSPLEPRPLGSSQSSPRALPRLEWWFGPGRYLLFCGALFVFLLCHSWTDAWRGDFWIYVATVRELIANPAHPRHALLGNDYAFVFISPYTWALGLAARLARLSALEAVLLQGLVNLMLLLGALYAFVATWLRRRSASFYALLFLLFLWGSEPWIFSGFFHLRSLALVLPYPSTFAAALALATLAAFARLAGAGSAAWIALVVSALALLWITHPVNGLFLWLGLIVWSLETRRPAWHWPALGGAFAASLALAMAWPFYSVWNLWFGQIDLVHAGNDTMYGEPLPRIAPALLGAPWLLLRLKRRPRDPLALLGLALAALVVCGGLLGAWSFGRLISHAVLLLQVALADAGAELEERLGRYRAALRHVLAPILLALLVAISWPAAIKPTLEESGQGNPAWLSFLESHVGHYDVVLTDPDTCWYVPSFGGKVVAFPMQIPFVPDHAERLRAVARFFERGVPRRERMDTIERYGARYVLLSKSHFGDWQGLLAELRPLGPAVYSSPEHELLRMK